MFDIGARESEIELLKSMFKVGEELIFEDTEDAEALVAPDKKTIGFIVKLPEGAELTVHLPPGYPSGNPSNPVLPTITVRLLPGCLSSGINERALCSRFSAWFEDTASSGEPVICSAIDWLQFELSSDYEKERSAVTTEHDQQLPTPVDEVSFPDESNNQSFVCLWIVSHHIRSPIKRRLIQDWASELKLTGCCMPGRPGIVIAEGIAANADEYWRRLRGLQWKHIQLRDREVLGVGEYKARRFSHGFEELFMKHQSRFQWLNERGISSNQFKVVFGIPGRLPQSTEGNKQTSKK